MSLPTGHLPERLSRRTELRSLVMLALPILTGQLAQSGMGAVDTLMAGAVSPQDLAAVAVGSGIWIPVFLFLIGTLMATTANVSHLWGASDDKAIAPLVRQALWLAVGLGLMGSLCLLNAHWLLSYFMDSNEELQHQTEIYLQGVAIGLPAIAIYQVLRYFCEGMGHTRPAMIVAILGLLCNIPFNYLFIYGGFGIEPMGGAGCGWATGIVMWIMCAVLGLYISFSSRYRPYEVLSHIAKPSPAVIIDLIKLGAPIGMAIFMESSLFAIIALLLTPLGESVVAAHQITLNFSGLSFMFPLSISMAVTIRVGQALGAGRPVEARFRSLTGLVLTLGYAAFGFTFMLTCGEAIASVYSNDRGVILMAANLLIYAALFQFSDATQVCIAGALRGYKDTRVPMILTCIAYWLIGLPLGWELAFGNHLTGEPMGAQGFWVALITGLTIAAILLSFRFNNVSKQAITRGAHPLAPAS